AVLGALETGGIAAKFCPKLTKRPCRRRPASVQPGGRRYEMIPGLARFAFQFLGPHQRAERLAVLFSLVAHGGGTAVARDVVCAVDKSKVGGLWFLSSSGHRLAVLCT